MRTTTPSSNTQKEKTSVSNPFDSEEDSLLLAAYDRIARLKKEFGKSLKVLALPILPSKLRRYADFIGCSDEILTYALNIQDDANVERVVVYGSRFLAESVYVLLNSSGVREKRKGQIVKVFAPSPRVDCPLAAATTDKELEECWRTLQTLFDPDSQVFPIACLSSATSVKAFCGRRGGATCTSKNARLVLDRAFERRPKVLFLPDSNLGRFAAYSVGLTGSDVALWRQTFDKGYDSLNQHSKEALEIDDVMEKKTTFNDLNDLRLRKMILWNGACPTYGYLDADQANKLRNERPDVRIAVPPRSSEEARRNADAVGDFDDVVYAVANTNEEIVWAIGFEKSFIRALKRKFPSRSFLGFGSEGTPNCEARQFNLRKLSKLLDSLEEDSKTCQISTARSLVEPTYAALKTMFELLR